MASFNKSSEAIDCHIHSVRYDMVRQSNACGRLRYHTSSGHLRRCSDADTIKKSLSRAKDASILSWPAMISHQKQ
eukprot:scaffold4846_cov152-Skeletonema_marinoi.AAC.10